MRVLIHVGDKVVKTVGKSPALMMAKRDPDMDDLVRRLLEAIAAAGQTRDALAYRFIAGLKVFIENRRGSTRFGRSEGKVWQSQLAHDYGFIANTKGADGDEMDAFIGPWPDAANVYVVDQYVNGKFDEHKCMLGFMSEDEARAGYLASYEPGWDGLHDITEMSVPQFKAWASQFRVNDEDMGHQFHGNQWTGGLGSKPTEVKAKGVKAGTHELLSSGHPFTMEELQKVTGATTLKQISDAIAMLKNPKYAGSQGTLEIVKEGGQYLVKAKVNAPIEEPLKPASKMSIEELAAELSNTSNEPDPIPEDLDPEPELEPGMLGFVPVEAKPSAGIMTKEAADKVYDDQMGYVLDNAQYLAKSGELPHETALTFKNGKAQAMAQWAANVKGHPVEPKPQDVFAADKQLIADLAAGKDKEAALYDWKKNTNLEKQGNFPPKAAINPMPKGLISVIYAPEPGKEHAQAFTAPASYIPEDHTHIEASDFASVQGASNGVFTKELNNLKAKLMHGHTDSIGNKIGVQKALEDRLATSPAFMQMKVEHGNKAGGSLVAALISSWASSSGDHKPVSVANQLATRDAFNMDPASVSTDAFHLLQSTGGDEHEVYAQAAKNLGIAFDTPATQATFKAGLQDFALAQYHETQAHFKKMGISEVYVARGMKIQHSGGPDLVNLKLQPASSFSANFGTAQSFAGGASMYFSKVPASQVLSSYATGFGCTNEHEVVVLAHPKMRAVRIPSGQAGGSMSNAATVIAKSLGAKPAEGMKPVFKSPSTKGAKHPLIAVAKKAAAKGDIEAVQKAHIEIHNGLKYPQSKMAITSLLNAAKEHAKTMEAWHAANPKKIKAVKAAMPAAHVNLTPTHTAGAHPPAHHAVHSHFDPQEYAAWQAKGYTEFQLGKKLAMKKFMAKKKG